MWESIPARQPINAHKGPFFHVAPAPILAPRPTEPPPLRGSTSAAACGHVTNATNLEALHHQGEDEDRRFVRVAACRGRDVRVAVVPCGQGQFT